MARVSRTADILFLAGVFLFAVQLMAVVADDGEDSTTTEHDTTVETPSPDGNFNRRRRSPSYDSYPQPPSYGGDYKPDYKPEYKPSYGGDYKPDYKPSYGGGYKPDYKPSYGGGYKPDYKPSYGGDYKPEYKPSYGGDYKPDYKPSHGGDYKPYQSGGYNPPKYY